MPSANLLVAGRVATEWASFQPCPVGKSCRKELLIKLIPSSEIISLCPEDSPPADLLGVGNDLKSHDTVPLGIHEPFPVRNVQRFLELHL